MSDVQRPVFDLTIPLYKRTPLSYWITLVFSTMNIVIGLGLFFAVDRNSSTAPLLIVNEVFTFHIWGAVFIILGLLQAASVVLIKRRPFNWPFVKRALLAGVMVKVTWAIALTVRIFVSDGTFLITIPWIALAAIQILTIIYFLPPMYDLEALQDKINDTLK